MLATSHGLLSKLGMIVGACAYDHELDVSICEEVAGCAIMLCVGIVDGAVLSRLDTVLVGGRLCALQKSVHLKVGVRGNEGQMKTFCGKAIAQKPDFDWRHGEFN